MSYRGLVKGAASLLPFWYAIETLLKKKMDKAIDDWKYCTGLPPKQPIDIVQKFNGNMDSLMNALDTRDGEIFCRKSSKNCSERFHYKQRNLDEYWNSSLS